MARKKQQGQYEVTGPDIRKNATFHERGPALSYAITVASRKNAPADSTWYVRNAIGDRVNHVETRDRPGLVWIYD
jgi:hypothetical protein